jgi:dihydrofolate reductase / thymidylate synthase
MYKIIAAVDEAGGIGLGGKIPWHYPLDLQYFREQTAGHTLIMGRITYESIGLQLPGRTTIIISSGGPCISLKAALHAAPANQEIFIAGGQKLYTESIAAASTLLITRIPGNYSCDRQFPPIPDHFRMKNSFAIGGLRFEEWESPNADLQYAAAIRTILSGPLRTTRNGRTLSTFCINHTFDLRTGFPLLTTKKMNIRIITDELLFFLLGRTDTNLLQSKIWKPNTSSEFLRSRDLPWRAGDMGPMYGFNWRHFGAPYRGCDQEHGGYDQLRALLNSLRDAPEDRRHLLTTYDPSTVRESVLAPCHGLISQFYVSGPYIDLFTYQRSADMALGYPYNIASYSIMLSIIAAAVNLKPRFLHIGLGDAHIYESHIDAISLQIKRSPSLPPLLSIREKKKEEEPLQYILSLNIDDISLQNYDPHPAVKYDLIP